MAGETILVVDDGPENREFVVEYVLKPSGFKHLTAKDGREGLQLALSKRPDLILLDLQMPRMNGIQVLEHLAQENVDIPVILMTFHGSEDIAVEVYRLGVKDYVKKPYTVEELLGAIDRSLTETRLRQEKEALTERVIQANKELHQRVQELNTLYKIGKSVTALVDINQLLPRIVDAATQLTQAEQGYLYLLVDGALQCQARKLHDARRAEAFNQALDDPIAAHVVNNGQPVVLTPEQMAKNPVANRPLVAAYVPLTLGKKIMGVLGVDNVSPEAHIFTQHDSALLSALSDYAAIAIENSRNYDALNRSKEAEKQQIRGTFERFVAPSVVDRVLAEPGELSLGGTRQEISVLFADIRGYTAWSENAPPERVVETLNHYLSMAAEIVLAWEGTLDKFFGDGLMAIFNAPEPQSDHVYRAADAALALMKAANEVNVIHGHRLTYSIGVTVGEAVVGYIGTERAMNYTAIGDVVNLAKRLQEYGSPGQILIDETMVKRLGDLAQGQALGELKVKGRNQPAYVYELQGLRSSNK